MSSPSFFQTIIGRQIAQQTATVLGKTSKFLDLAIEELKARKEEREKKETKEV